MKKLEQELNEFLLSENENMIGFLDNLKEEYSLNFIYEILINMFLNTEKSNFLLKNRILRFINTIFQFSHIDIEKSDLIVLDNLLGQTSYLTNFEGLDDALVAELIYKKNNSNRIALVNKKVILEDRTIKEVDGLSFYTKSFLEGNELFGIHAYDLLPIHYFNLNNESHTFFTPSFVNYNPVFQDAFLIFSYIGDNLCREFYTGKIVNIIDDNSGIDSLYKKSNSETLNSSVKAFRIINRSPLGIKSDKFIVDDKFKNLILEQSEQKEQIAAAINEMYDRVDKKNKANIEKIVSEDYTNAKELNSLECDLIEFKKDTKKLFLEREENKEKSS